MTGRQHLTADQREADEITHLTGLMWHACLFIGVGPCLWLLDARGAGGIDWAPIITTAWGFALAAHVLAHRPGGRQVRAGNTRGYRRDEHPSPSGHRRMLAREYRPVDWWLGRGDGY